MSAILQNKGEIKYKDTGCPIFSCVIWNFKIDRALLDLGASVNSHPYSMYEQLGLRELKPTTTTLLLVDKSIKIPRRIVEDVLV